SLDLRGMHVLPAGDDHVVLAADNRHVLVLVPGRQIADIQPPVVKTGVLLGRLVDVGVAGLGRAHDHLSDLAAVLGDQVVGLGAAVLVDPDHGDVIVGAGPSG